MQSLCNFQFSLMVCADRFSTELPGSEFHFTPEDQILSYRAFRNVAPLILGSAKRLPVSKFCVLLHEKYLPVLELVQSVGAGFLCEDVRLNPSIRNLETAPFLRKNRMVR
jgi:hypothetical protein